MGEWSRALICWMKFNHGLVNLRVALLTHSSIVAQRLFCIPVVFVISIIAYDHRRNAFVLASSAVGGIYWVSGTSPPAPAMPDDKYSSVENCAGHLVLWLLRPVKLHRINSRINTVIIILCNKMCMCAHAQARAHACVCVWLISDTWHKVWHLWISVMHTADLIFKNKNTLKKIKTEQV